MGNGILAGYIREVFEPLNIVMDRFSFPLYGGDEFNHGYFGVVLVKMRKESSL